MSVVHLINALPPLGGAERLILNLARLSPRKPVPVITWHSTNNALLQQDTDGAIDHIPLRPFTWRNLARARRAISKADVLHVHLFPTLYAAAFLPGRKIFTEHNITNRRRGKKWLRPAERFIYGRYQRVVTLNTECRNALADWLLNPPHLTIIENGIPVASFHGRPRLLGGSIVHIGMAGRFSTQKDQDTIIRALSILPTNIHAHFAGAGPRLKEVEMLARRLGVADRTHFHGIITNMPAFLDRLHLYVQSSHWEGYGLAVAEAMASGLPSLATNIPGVRDIPGNSARLFPPADERVLAQKITELVGDPVTYAEASRESLKRAPMFDISRTAAAYEKLYNTITG